MADVCSRVAVSPVQRLVLSVLADFRRGQREERGRVNAALADGPRRDVNAVIARLRRGQIPALQRASWQVYDKYLKANRVEAGVRSYGEVVTLLLRARFAPEWVPVRRDAP
jgi:hypothetical protein